jgi:hypothetical protein
MTSEKKRIIREVVSEKLPLCNCGSESWELVRELLENAEKGHDEGKVCFYEAWKDASPRWVELVAKVLDSVDLIEHGSSIGWCSLTDKGKLVLNFLRKYSCYTNNWPEWSYVFRVGQKDGTWKDIIDIEEESKE